MREIKFRAWFKGVMYPPLSLEAICDCAANSGGKGLGELKDAEFMQFTGLKDSNGVEIYEGDIVYLAGYGLYEVEFPFTELYDSVMENDIGEIKGNIHENPELLND